MTSRDTERNEPEVYAKHQVDLVSVWMFVCLYYQLHITFNFGLKVVCRNSLAVLSKFNTSVGSWLYFAEDVDCFLAKYC